MKSVSLLGGACLALLAALAPATAQPLKGEAGPNFETAGPNDIRVYITTAIAQPLTPELMAKADKAIGKHVVLSWGSARGSIHDAMIAGKGDFEVAIVLPDVNQDALAKGKIKPTTYDVMETPGAFQVRGNATVDVSTPDAIKKTLLGATSVVYSPTGAALLTTRKVLDTLQIADKIKDNSHNGGKGPVELTGNQYEIGIYPLSEIIFNKGVTNLGPVIPQLQGPAVIQASIGVNSRDDAGGKAFIAWLKGPETDASFKADGFAKSKMEASK
jgi:molybdate transport system substrate-binding protein